jgi:type IV pilus assembly protein PilV
MMNKPLLITASRPGRRAASGVRQRGVGLIEVLIAFFVLSIGLLGLATMQMKTVQYNQGAYIRSQATVAAYDIMDRMRVNLTQARANAYNVSYGSAGSGPGQTGPDLAAWNQFITSNLPDGQGQIQCSAANMCRISVRWRDRFSTDPNAWEEVTVSSQM